MTNEEIQKHIEQNCRNEHGEPMMDEQSFYEGAKWSLEKVKNCSVPDFRQQRELLKAFIRWNNQHNGVASPVPEKMADNYLENL